jgi:hypothetical protein
MLEAAKIIKGTLPAAKFLVSCAESIKKIRGNRYRQPLRVNA